MKRICLSLSIVGLGLSLWVGLDRFFYKEPSGFSPKKVHSCFAFHPEWEIPYLGPEKQAEIDVILDQSWKFFNKGSQAYVFISEDGQYVLKFFKQHKLRETTSFSYILWDKNPFYLERQKRLEKAFSTFMAPKLAYLHFPEETGIVFLHLNPTRTHKVRVSDKRGKSYMLDIGKTSFMLQKKADLIYPRIQNLMKEGNIEKAKEIVSSVLQLIYRFGKAGVVDNDPILRKNFGLIQDRAIQFDIGKFRMDPLHQISQSEIREITKSFYKWASQYPELADYFEEELKKF